MQHSLEPLDLASVSPSLRPVSNSVRRMHPSVSANVRRKLPLIARRTAHHCAPLQLAGPARTPSFFRPRSPNRSNPPSIADAPSPAVRIDSETEPRRKTGHDCDVCMPKARMRPLRRPVLSWSPSAPTRRLSSYWTRTGRECPADRPGNHARGLFGHRDRDVVGDGAESALCSLPILRDCGSTGPAWTEGHPVSSKSRWLQVPATTFTEPTNKARPAASP